MDELSRIANAVLYEGYVLWPYGRSALKNQKRWTFGGVYPGAHSACHEDDPCEMRTECLVEGGPRTRLDVKLRFLHVVRRDVARSLDGDLEFVDELKVNGTRYLAWDEATERELEATGLELEALEVAEHHAGISIDAGRQHENIAGGDEQGNGVLVRSWERLEGTLAIYARSLGPRLFRVGVRLVNTTPRDGNCREEVLRRTFVSTHAVLETSGEFVSLTDPPAEFSAAAEGCHNGGWWPVLVGTEGERQTVLSSPIILPDYPRVASESPGDLFDGGEIDQLLILNILALSDTERAEMRDSDPRAREILERVESMSSDELMRLNGAIRDFQMQRP